MHLHCRGNLDIFMQTALGEKSPLLGNATPIMDVIKTGELRRIAELVFGPSQLARPLAAPPGTPEDRVAALRMALLATTRDPDAIVAAQKAGMSLRPKSGEELKTLIADFQATPAQLAKKAFAYTHE